MLKRLLRSVVRSCANAEPLQHARPPDEPDSAALKSLALGAEQQGRFDEAEVLYQSYLERCPHDDQTWHRFAALLRSRGRATQALRQLEAAVVLNPRLLWAQIAIAGIRRERGELAEAVSSYETVLRLDPAGPLAARVLGNIGMVQRERGQVDQALSCLQRAATLAPGIAEIHYNYGLLLCELGEIDGAAEEIQKAIALQPDFAEAHSALLCIKGLYRHNDPAEVYKEHVLWAQRYADPLTARSAPHVKVRDAHHRLSIGYVSGDFREHSVSYFIEPILAHHDRSQFSVYCYDNFRGSDAVNSRMRRYADCWRKINALDDEQAAALIRSDGIDILVDLSGHTTYNRLLVFARKPAPIQATWLGYMCTTGLAAIDYRITDPYLDPPGATEHHYSETLIRIPSAVTFSPAPDSPAVNALPALAKGHITFGSLNSYSKITDEAIAAWGHTLRQLPQSRLLLVANNGDHPAQQEQIAARFERLGAPPGRVEIMGYRPIQDFLRLFNGIDIALDPFPCTGGTTSLHTLWMGVPMISMEGDTELSRSTAGILRSMGLEQLVVQNVGDYVDGLVRLARDMKALAAVRASMRERMKSCALLDSSAVTRSLEGAYREMWLRYIDKNRLVRSEPLA